MRDTPHRTITELEDRLRRANQAVQSSYTLAEIRELRKDYIRQLVKRDGEIDPVIRIIIDRFVEWMAQREKGQPQ